MKEINYSVWDHLWKQRYDGTAGLAAEIERAIMSEEPSYEVLWRHARLEHFLAMQAEETDAAAYARHMFAADIQADKAMKLEPNRVEGLFWAGVAGIEAARVRGGLAVATALRGARQHLEQAAALDASFHEAGPYRVLGRIAQRAPRILGGDLKAALDFYRRSLDIAFDNSTTLLYLAETQRELKDEASARRTLLRIIEAPVQPHWRWEQERDKRRARLLLAETTAADKMGGSSGQTKDDS
jgi:hypothetical protein